MQTHKIEVPLISVIMPVYNAEKYLKEAIDSILIQTEANFELIIINDGSTDTSLSIIEEYENLDSRVKVIDQKNKGLVYSLNLGITEAKGKYIARMDADDISLENRFKEQVKLLDDGYDLCGCHFHLITEDGNLSSSRVVSIDSDFQSVILTRSTPFAHGSVMIRKAFLLKNNLEYSRKKYTSAEDYYLWVQCFEHGARITNADNYLFSYRDFDSSLSKMNSKKNLSDARMISREFIQNNFNKIERDLEATLSNRSSLTSFEQEQLGFYLFNTILKRNIKKTSNYLNFVKVDLKLLSFFRAARHILPF